MQAGSDQGRCAKCGTVMHLDDLDAKPPPRVDDWLHGIARTIWLWWTGKPTYAWDDPGLAGDWTVLECRDCYGPGYVSNRDVDGMIRGALAEACHD